ncbi:MAG TPA: hypothetical protein VK078_09480 [Pseudogracilibacillus sp.]|nr:hypothetical protein [Pseudogracilibacillus sp.]
MNNKLVPLYRERESYTLFYEPKNNALYKLQHRNKSFGGFFILMLATYWFSKLLNRFYEDYQNSFLNIVIFIFAIGITYYIASIFYRSYYNKETKREIILDKIKLQEYAVKGLKQLRIEFYSSVVLLPINVIFFTIFFITGDIDSLVIGCIFSGAVFILGFMKPMSRKRILKKIENNLLDI